jgi:hypothetical protein
LLGQINSRPAQFNFRKINYIMEGILYVTYERGQKRFLQIDLNIHGKLWDDFYDLLIANTRDNEKSIPYDVVKDELKKYGKL